jgi:hypothetical protein
MSTAQQRRLAADKKADAKLADRLATEVVKVRSKNATCTAEDVVRERDERGLSWKQVAINLELGSPSAARTAYTRLTGRPHNESNTEVKRAPRLPKSVVRAERRKTLHPKWTDDSDQDEIIERIDGSVIVVRRVFRKIELPEERIAVGRIDSFRFDGANQDGPLCVTIIDRETSASRTFRVADIVEVL